MDYFTDTKKKIIYDPIETIEALKEFHNLYAKRPVKNNSGGMQSPHLFNTWYALKKLKPKLVIESGVWKGLGTWAIEKALPSAQIISIDVDYSHLEFKSSNATYLDKDIKTHNWDKVFNEQYPDIKRNEIVVFLDDHQDFLERLEFIYNLGIKHILYEDNYPSSQGDVLSPKKILSCQDYIMERRGIPQMNQFSYFDYDKFVNFVKTYEELPPIFKLDKTRWKDKWDPHTYPTIKALLPLEKQNEFPIFFEEALSYTWLCYMELK